MSSENHGSPSTTMARTIGARRAAVTSRVRSIGLAAEAALAPLELGQGVVEVVGGVVGPELGGGHPLRVRRQHAWRCRMSAVPLRDERR